MQREQRNNREDREHLSSGRTMNTQKEVSADLENDDMNGILETPVSRMDGETPFGNVSDNYITAGGDEEDDDDDDLEDDDLEDDNMDDVEVADTDPAIEALDDDDLLLEEDEDDEDEDDL